jgi:hypothetical protein
MLNSGFKEARENRLVVNNVEPEAMETALHYIYTDEFDADKASVDVLELAHMFHVDELLGKCCNELAFDIDAETICEILPAAYVYDREFLFRHAAAFFKESKDQIMDGEYWLALSSHRELVHVLLQDI